MAFYNYVVVEETCPVCGQETEIECQTHVASARGDATGDFHDRVYKLGQRMSWYPNGHPDFAKWKGDHIDEGDDCVTETCYGSCRAHGDKVLVAILFCDRVPCLVVQSYPMNERRLEYPE